MLKEIALHTLMTILLSLNGCSVLPISNQILPQIFFDFDLVSTEDLTIDEANGTNPPKFKPHSTLALEKPQSFEINKAYTFHLRTEKSSKRSTFEIFKERLLANGFTITREHEDYLFAGEKYIIEFNDKLLKGRITTYIDQALLKDGELNKIYGIQDYKIILYK